MSLDRRTVAVAIVGGARTGTSATAIGLQALGVYLGRPEHLSGVDSFNPEGYRENALINDLNLETLALFPNVANANPVLPENWQDHPAATRMLLNYRRFFSQYFSGRPVWGWKDPRTTILIPIYREAFQTLNVDLHFIMPLRSPIDSAQSMMKRDECSFNVGLGLWTHYALTTLRHLTGTPLHVFDYGNYLLDPRSSIEPLFATMATNPSESDWNALRASIRPDLNHGVGRQSIELENLPVFVGRTYALAQGVADDLPGYANGAFDSEIDRLWQDWIGYRSLRNSYSRKATLRIDGIKSHPVELGFDCEFGWSRVEAEVEGHEPWIYLTFEPVGWVYFLRNLAWVKDSGESQPVTLQAAPSAYIGWSDNGVCQVLPHAEFAHLRTQRPNSRFTKLTFELQFHWGPQMTAVTLARLGKEYAALRSQPLTRHR